MCGSSYTSPALRTKHAGTSLFAHLNEGDMIEVEHSDGTSETIELPARGDDYISCFDPFRRDSRLSFNSSYQRDDGVVIMTLPTFGNHPDHPFPDALTLQSYRDWNSEAIEIINADLANYDNITGLVWDIRGNTGGSAEYSMGLLGSLGSVEGELGNCFPRVAESSPPEFGTDVEYPFPYQIFADQPLTTVSYSGPQVIVADEIATSAADWMLYRASVLGISIFGQAGTAAFGYARGGAYVDQSIEPGDNTIGVGIRVAGARCLDSEGIALEGRTFIDNAVEFSAADLAAGIDTQLEAAVASLLQ